MTWQQYAKLWLARNYGDVNHLSKEQAARYIVAVVQFVRATPAMRAAFILRLKP